MNRIDLIGIFYNEYYLLEITDISIQLRTNIGTVHKPFYTDVIYKEKYDFNIEDKHIKILDI